MFLLCLYLSLSFSFLASAQLSVFSLQLVVNFDCNLASEAHPRLLTLVFGKLAIDACSTSLLAPRQFRTTVWTGTLPNVP